MQKLNKKLPLMLLPYNNVKEWILY